LKNLKGYGKLDLVYLLRFFQGVKNDIVLYGVGDGRRYKSKTPIGENI
jgi:hypothetical protein